jgi:hypothetical protein
MMEVVITRAERISATRNEILEAFVHTYASDAFGENNFENFKEWLNYSEISRYSYQIINHLLEDVLMEFPISSQDMTKEDVNELVYMMLDELDELDEDTFNNIYNNLEL